MYFVYILKSINNNYFYTGFSNDLKKRLIEHNSGEVKSSSPYCPFRLVYYEACINEKDARFREKYLKSNLGKKYLKKRLKFWSNIQTGACVNGVFKTISACISQTKLLK
jgi:putative endonuclease